MDQTTLTTVMSSLGYGQYVGVVLAVIGFFSAVSTVYPADWKGAYTVHKLALLVGKAYPATPASSVVEPPVIVTNSGSK